MKTEVYIKVTISHDSAKVKHHALEQFCGNLKEGDVISGQNGLGEQFELKVTKFQEIKIK